MIARRLRPWEIRDSGVIVDLIRVGLVRYGIRETWNSDERLRRERGLLPGDPLPTPRRTGSGYKLTDQRRARILQLVQAVDADGRPRWTYLEIAHRLDVCLHTVLSVGHAAGLRRARG